MYLVTPCLCRVVHEFFSFAFFPFLRMNSLKQGNESMASGSALSFFMLDIFRLGNCHLSSKMSFLCDVCVEKFICCSFGCIYSQCNPELSAL